MGLIRRTYTFLDETSFRLLFQALVRPKLEYAVAVWFPYTKKDIGLIENVQRRATKEVPSLKQLSYTDQLKKLKMPLLKNHRLRGDMIETFKIINGIYDKEVTERFFEMSRTDQTSCNNVAPVTNLCLGRATTRSHSSQWSKKKVAVET